MFICSHGFLHQQHDSGSSHQTMDHWQQFGLSGLYGQLYDEDPNRHHCRIYACVNFDNFLEEAKTCCCCCFSQVKDYFIINFSYLMYILRLII